MVSVKLFNYLQNINLLSKIQYLRLNEAWTYSYQEHTESYYRSKSNIRYRIIVIVNAVLSLGLLH